MATQIGEIKIVFGSATVTSANGDRRVILDGDPVFSGDVITVDVLTEAKVQYNDGHSVDITETFVADDNADVAVLQAAIEAGADPSKIAEPTAAGQAEAESNEGVDFVEVLHLAPEVTPTSGFDTTGIAIEFPEREFQLGLLDQEDSVFSSTPVPPVPSDTPPVADPVATRSNLTSDSLPFGFPVTNPVYFKAFDVGGGLDGDLSIAENGLVDPADLGGFDTETVETNLSFKFESLPDYGDLYVFDGSSYTKIDVSNINTVTFSTVDNVYWAASQAQVLAVTSSGVSHTVSFLNGLDIGAVNAEGLSLSGFALNGDAAPIIAITDDGLGVDAPGDRIGQLEFDEGESESIVFDFAKDSINAEISVTHLIATEEAGEIGVVTAFLDGNEVGQWTFTAGATAIADFSPLNGNVDVSSVGPGNGNGSVTFTLGNTIFDQLIFTAAESHQPNPNVNDSSDYFVAEIAYDDLSDAPNVGYSYSVTDQDLNTSPPAEVVIGVSEPSSTTTLLAASDLFTWTPADLPNMGTGHDVVSSFDVLEGDILDLSDLLQDSGVSSQIDGLAVGNAGSEHLQINIKDTAGNVVQELELVDVSVFNSVAAQTTLNQLIDNGHVIVD
jgi:hypothetical protein